MKTSDFKKHGLSHTYLHLVSSMEMVHNIINDCFDAVFNGILAFSG